MAALDALAAWACQATLLVFKDAAAPAAVGVDYAKLWAGYAELYDRVLRVRDNCADDVAAAKRHLQVSVELAGDVAYVDDACVGGLDLFVVYTEDVNPRVPSGD